MPGFGGGPLAGDEGEADCGGSFVDGKSGHDRADSAQENQEHGEAVLLYEYLAAAEPGGGFPEDYRFFADRNAMAAAAYRNRGIRGHGGQGGTPDGEHGRFLQAFVEGVQEGEDRHGVLRASGEPDYRGDDTAVGGAA